MARALIDEGMRVYGLGGDYREMPFNNENFRPVPCDLARPDELTQAAGKILHEEEGIALLVHNAKVYPAQAFAETEPDLLQHTVLVNQLAPLLLTRTLLPGLLRVRGAVVNIAPGLESAPRGGPAGALSAGGMRAFHQALAREFFPTGLRVTTLCPEPWRKDEVTLQEGQQASPFDATEIAKVLCTVLRTPDALQTTEIIVRPGAPREASANPIRELPKPPPQPVPYTVPREQIEAEELLEEAEQARKEGRNISGRKRSHRSSEHERRMRMVAQLLAAEAAMAEADEDGEMPDFNKVADTQAEAARSEATGEDRDAESEGEDGEDGPKKRSRRRRGGRGRGRQREEQPETEESPAQAAEVSEGETSDPGARQDSALEESPENAEDPEGDLAAESHAAEPSDAESSGEAEAPQKKRRRRNRGRTTQPPGTAFYPSGPVGSFSGSPVKPAPGKPSPKPIQPSTEGESKAQDPEPQEVRDDIESTVDPVQAGPEISTEATDDPKLSPVEDVEPTAVGVTAENESPSPAGDPSEVEAEETSPAGETKPPAKKVTRKTAKKKAATKKTTRKVAKKATKKAATKAATKRTAKKTVTKKATAKKSTAKKGVKKAATKSAD